ncbi:hypothetical protein D3C87_1572290 [compost metagenome]
MRWRVQEWLSTKMQWPRIRLSPRMPRLSRYCTAVRPVRRSSSSCSAIVWAEWMVIGMPRLRAAAAASCSNSAEQVSICDGATTPARRPEGWAAAASTTSSARAKASRPRALSQMKSRRWLSSTCHCASRKPGATKARAPLRARVGSQLSCGPAMSSSVVTPERIKSPSITVSDASMAPSSTSSRLEYS